MKCLSRSTLGVAIGGINIFGFTITIIHIIIVLCDFSTLKEEDKRENDAVYSTSVTLLYILLAICVVAVIISGLLVVGILKRRHNLMRPWIYCAVAGIVCHIFRLIVGVIGGLISGMSFVTVLLALLLGLFILSLQYLIFRSIYNLYKDIRDNGNELERASLNTGIDPAVETGANTAVEAGVTTGADTGLDKPPSYSELERTGKLYN